MADYSLNVVNCPFSLKIFIEILLVFLLTVTTYFASPSVQKNKMIHFAYLCEQRMLSRTIQMGMSIIRKVEGK